MTQKNSIYNKYQLQRQENPTEKIKPFKEKYYIEVFNTIGQTIYRDEKKGESIVKIDLTGQANGVYIVKIIAENNIKNIKIIKANQ